MSETKTVEFTAVYANTGAVQHFILTLEEEYSEATNQSTVSITQIRLWNSTYRGVSGRMHGLVKLNGITALTVSNEYCELRKESNPYTVTPEANSTVITREDDGSLELTVRLEGTGERSGFGIVSSPSFYVTSGTEKTAVFTAQPRASAIASVTSAASTLGSISLLVSPKKSGVKHKVSFSTAGTALLTSDFFETSYALTVPRSWFTGFPDTAQLTVTASVQTYNADGTPLASPVTASVSVTADEGMKPAVSSGWAAVSPYNTGAISGITGYVQGYSRAQAAFDTAKITHADGAALAGFSISCMGQTDTAAPYLTDIITGVCTAVCTVTDTRGRSTSETFTITPMSYSPPGISGIGIFRCDSSGTEDEDGSYFSVCAALNISGLEGQNTGTLAAAFKIRGGAYGADTALSSGTASVIGTASPDSTCIVRITACDAVGGSALYEQTVPARAWAMKFRSGGMGVAFGRAPTADNVLELPTGWSIKIGDTTLSEAQLSALLELI